MSSIKFLKAVDIFSHLDNKTLEEIDNYIKFKQYSKDELIFIENDKVEDFLLLFDGKVEVYKSNENGKKFTIWYIRPKEPFCLAAFVLGEAVSNVRAAQKSTVCHIHKRDMDVIFKKHPDIYMNIMQTMSHRLYIKSKILENIALNDTKMRIFDILTSKHYAGDNCTIRLSQNEIAALSGVCRETVCRILSKLKKDGILDIGQKQIVVKDIQKLQSYCRGV